MKRRTFLQNTALVSTATLLPAFLRSANALGIQRLTQMKRVIVIQLSGGNDGLNTIVPYRNDLYYQHRPKLGLTKDNVLPITDELGANPALEALSHIYDNGEMTIINNVGYPNPNRSHFRSMDIWHTASGADEYLSTGWLGRYLDAHCQHPWQVLEVDDTLSLASKGEHLKGIAASDINILYNTTKEPYFDGVVKASSSAHLNEDNLGYLYKTMVETHQSADYIFEKSKIYKTKVDYPRNQFGRHLKNIGHLIGSGLETRVYYASLSGFDTHVNQAGQQERLLTTYSEAVAALVKDLKNSGEFDNTLIMTFSEFGRRVQQNASGGTDHGTANNLFLISGKLRKAGIYNEAPNLSQLDDNGDLIYSLDFRQIYATILNNWLEVNEKDILLKEFDALPIV